MTRTPPDPLLIDLVQFLSFQQDEKDAKASANEVKSRLTELVKERGYEDERGNYYLDLLTPVTVGDKTVSTLKVERRTSLLLNEDRLLLLAKEKGVEDRVKIMVEVIDQEEIYVLYAEGVINEQEFDSLFDKEYSYAFRPML